MLPRGAARCGSVRLTRDPYKLRLTPHLDDTTNGAASAQAPTAPIPARSGSGAIRRSATDPAGPVRRAVAGLGRGHELCEGRHPRHQIRHLLTSQGLEQGGCLGDHPDHVLGDLARAEPAAVATPAV